MRKSGELRWGILGTGRIAGMFAKGIAGSHTGRLVAVGSRTQAAADKFGKQFRVENRHSTYEALLADSEVEAVYIATPHPMHAEWAIKAAEAGKHILCEKPLTLNHSEAMAVIEAVRRHNVFLMEAFMYRCHPQTAKLVELIREKAIGEVRVIQATFSYLEVWNPKSITYANELGGGGILDVGCYPVSMARLIAGAATGKDFTEPVEIKGTAHLGQTGVDEWAIASLKFPNDIIAQLSTGIAVDQENVVRIFGSEGSIIVPSPWLCAPRKGTANLIVQRRDEKKPRLIVTKSRLGLYSLEADIVAAHIAQREAPSPAMNWDDTLGNMKALEEWRASIGFTYNSEKIGFPIPTLTRRSIRVRSGNTMKYRLVTGIEKPVSRLVMGAMLSGAWFPCPHGHVLFDDFFERGGNCFDTAHQYLHGGSEKILGQWIKNRGVRKDVVILGKGAHTPFCDPANLTKQLLESLDRLQTDHLDIYLMHRDNPAIPAGEFVDVLNEHQHKGRVRAFGGSNWSIARVEEANAYARRKGLTGFAAVSNNFSLARMVDPIWTGCIHASDSKSRAWFEQTQLALFAWSSQARGFFFVGDPKNHTDAQLVRCWYSDENFRRLERARQLAKERGVLPNHIALAYVLNQPFPTFALIGPQTLSETRTSWPALEVDLTQKEIRWLNLGE